MLPALQQNWDYNIVWKQDARLTRFTVRFSPNCLSFSAGLSRHPQPQAPLEQTPHTQWCHQVIVLYPDAASVPAWASAGYTARPQALCCLKMQVRSSGALPDLRCPNPDVQSPCHAQPLWVQSLRSLRPCHRHHLREQPSLTGAVHTHLFPSQFIKVDCNFLAL